MNAKTDLFFNELKEAVEDDSLVLPSLPEVAACSGVIILDTH